MACYGSHDSSNYLLQDLRRKEVPQQLLQSIRLRYGSCESGESGTLNYKRKNVSVQFCNLTFYLLPFNNDRLVTNVQSEATIMSDHCLVDVLLACNPLH